MAHWGQALWHSLVPGGGYCLKPELPPQPPPTSLNTSLLNAAQVRGLHIWACQHTHVGTVMMYSQLKPLKKFTSLGVSLFLHILPHTRVSCTTHYEQGFHTQPGQALLPVSWFPESPMYVSWWSCWQVWSRSGLVRKLCMCVFFFVNHSFSLRVMGPIRRLWGFPELCPKPPMNTHNTHTLL